MLAAKGAGEVVRATVGSTGPVCPVLGASVDVKSSSKHTTPHATILTAFATGPCTTKKGTTNKHVGHKTKSMFDESLLRMK